MGLCHSFCAGVELFSDSYKMTLLDDVLYEVEGKARYSNPRYIFGFKCVIK